jgi:ATP synthase subunit 6
MSFNSVTTQTLGSPLEQFSLVAGLCSSHTAAWLGFPLYSDNFRLQLFLLFAVLGSFYLSSSLGIPLHLQNNAVYLRGRLFGFVTKLIQSQTSKQGLVPLFLFLFLLLLFGNLLGMIPYTYTITSQFVATLCLALCTFLVINLLHIHNQKLTSVVAFLPAGAPLPIIPFLLQIEIISYISRIFSLIIRLFANMTSCHTLIKILCSFFTSLITAGGAAVFTLPLLGFVIFLVTGL